MSDIIVIGAGAAGLTAARLLSQSGKSVTVLEARARIGGRIFTLHNNGFSGPVETGAEFIHGKLPHTLALAKEAGVTLRKGKGKSWHVVRGEKEKGDAFDPGQGKVKRALHHLDHDMPVADFLASYFGGEEDEVLRQTVISFVQGFDAADPSKASSFALREEWASDDALTGYHLEGGYSQLIHFLHQHCVSQEVDFHLSTVVKEIHWKKNDVTIVTDTGARFTATNVLITVPPAVLKAGAITFFPEIRTHQEAFCKIETGGVIKFLFEFTEPLWEQKNSFRQFSRLHFLFTDAGIPTWWTQSPAEVPLLTGWLSGPATNDVKESEQELIERAVQALSYIFDCDEAALKAKIRACQVIDWAHDPFSRGAYGYKTLETPGALQALSQAVEDTLYFGGEAYYQGSAAGTVEAALVSGEEKAKEMLR